MTNTEGASRRYAPPASASCSRFFGQVRGDESRVPALVDRQALHGLPSPGGRHARRAPAPAYPPGRFIEVDHPATQAVKRLAIDERRNLDFIAANLAEERLQDALAGGAYRRDAPSVFVIEGLLMYLTDAQIAVLFAAIAELQRAPGTLVFTMMAPACDGRPRFHNATPLVTGLLSLWSEPLQVGAAARGGGAAS